MWSMPPPPKRRKVGVVEDIEFDSQARQEYLTGFHKRKLQRIKHARDEAAKKIRDEKIEARKQVSYMFKM
jgi:ribosomal RNA-processing protein 17